MFPAIHNRPISSFLKAERGFKLKPSRNLKPLIPVLPPHVSENANSSLGTNQGKPPVSKEKVLARHCLF